MSSERAHSKEREKGYKILWKYIGIRKLGRLSNSINFSNINNPFLRNACHMMGRKQMNLKKKILSIERGVYC